MKTKFINKSLLIFSAITFIAISCSDDKEVVVENQQLSQTEVKTILESDSYTKSFDNIITGAYNNDTTTGKTNECYETSYSDAGFTITFDSCTVEGTDNVTGTLTAVYTSTANEISYTVTWSDFVYGDKKIEGTRSYTINSDGETAISYSTTSNLKITLSDESIVSETGTKEISLTFGSSLESSIYTLSGEWTVVSDGLTYVVTVADTIEGNLSCAYLNNGSMTVAKSGLIVSVDFGDGKCDDVATVKYPNGDEEEISLRD